jgi:hypothetical protein
MVVIYSGYANLKIQDLTIRIILTFVITLKK